MSNYNFSITRATLRATPEVATHWLDVIRKAVYDTKINPSVQADDLHISSATFSAFLTGES